MGFADEDVTNQMALVVSMWREAVGGNVRAAEFLRDTAGQNEKDNADRRIKQKEFKLKQEELDYRKAKDAGISQEIEDMDDIEGDIYG